MRSVASDPVELDRVWARDVAEVLEAFRVDPSRGLREGEARKRLQKLGKNLLRETKPKSAWRILVDQFRSLVVGLLGLAAIVSFTFARWLEGVAILVVLAFNAAIGFATEFRAVRSMEALRRLSRTTAKVLRDGHVREIPASMLVTGDVVLLEGGDIVTADLRLLEASKVQADESTLTGESMPVGKQADAVDDGAPLAERRCMLFKGTAVTRGSAVGVVTATGMSTELGRIASLAQEAEKAETPLERRLERLGRRLIWITLGIAVVTTVAGILRGQDVLLMVETGIALAVAAIPEGLPIVATLALARGMWRMARHDALINRLSAVETLGATGIILTDKTGTLTENRMTIVQLSVPAGDIRIEGRGLAPRGAFACGGEPVDPARPDLRTLVEIGVLCNNAALEYGEAEPDGADAVGDPMEVALLVLGRKAGIDRSSLLEGMPERREEAFDPTTRAMATFHEHEGRFRVAVKGAAETVLPACRRRLEGDRILDLDGEERRRWLARADELATEGLRVLALAEKSANSVGDAPYEDLTFVGLIGMLDPPREEARAELARCRKAGIRVVMVTGDQPGTAASIARELELNGHTAPVVGADLPDLDHVSVEDRRRLLEVPVFARVDPEQKLKLIQLHQEAGSIVAMTGDGVNDAPALRKADIGVAMGQRGTQVAREAADMVLQNDAFSSIVRAVRQGRIIFSNIRRFAFYLLSCNISEVMIVFIASSFGAPLPVLPLQILYLNLVTDVFPAMALGFGEGDDGVMARSPRDPGEAILDRRHWIAIGVYGLIISASVLGALWIALGQLQLREDQAVTVSFLTLAFSQVWHVFNMRSVGSTLLRNDVVGSRWIWSAVALCSMLLVAAVHVPGLASVLGTGSPGAAGWTLALGASLVPLLAGQTWLEVRRLRRRSTGE
ncbi:cation-transporting P-type ATPase [bacterium]|nr:cation-transporting P-type ATPase [bacterium]